MAREVEVTFYREIEGTENLVSHLPLQMDSVLGIRRVLCSSIRRSPNYSYTGRGWLSQWNATGRKWLQRLELPRAKWKATLERVWMSQWLWTYAFTQHFLLSQEGGGGGWGLEAQPTHWSSDHDILDMTQAHFDFWQWHCVCFPH